MKLITLLLLVCGVFCSASAALACKTPEELRVAFEACHKAGDTNQLWKLYCWTNVSAEDQRLHKSLTKDSVVHIPGKKLLRCETMIGPAPAYANTPQPLKQRGGFLKPNIPVTGAIGIRKAWEGGLGTDDFVEFGKGPDGNYWLVVTIFVKGTNAK